MHGFLRYILESTCSSYFGKDLKAALEIEKKRPSITNLKTSIILMYELLIDELNKHNRKENLVKSVFSAIFSSIEFIGTPSQISSYQAQIESLKQDEVLQIGKSFFNSESDFKIEPKLVQDLITKVTHDYLNKSGEFQHVLNIYEILRRGYSFEDFKNVCTSSQKDEARHSKIESFVDEQLYYNELDIAQRVQIRKQSAQDFKSVVEQRRLKDLDQVFKLLPSMIFTLVDSILENIRDSYNSFLFRLQKAHYEVFPQKNIMFLRNEELKQIFRQNLIDTSQNLHKQFDRFANPAPYKKESPLRQLDIGSSKQETASKC